jgi:hypothetical protein
VLCEVVVDGRIALEAPNGALFLPLAVENRLQKRRDLLPGDLGLCLAIAAGHGVVQKTMGRVRVNANVEAFSGLGEHISHTKDVF